MQQPKAAIGGEAKREEEIEGLREVAMGSTAGGGAAGTVGAGAVQRREKSGGHKRIRELDERRKKEEKRERERKEKRDESFKRNLKIFFLSLYSVEKI